MSRNCYAVEARIKLAGWHRVGEFKDGAEAIRDAKVILAGGRFDDVRRSAVEAACGGEVEMVRVLNLRVNIESPRRVLYAAHFSDRERILSESV